MPRVNPAPVPSSCSECFFLKDCGGLDGPESHVGCFQRCEQRCRQQGCDCVCPGSPVGFDGAWEEVGGICKPPAQCLQKPSLPLPPYYVPQIIHGSLRSAGLDSNWVSIPIESVVRFDRNGCNIPFKSSGELRHSLKIAQSARIILTSVSHDWILERFWANHRYRDLIDKIAALDFYAVTVPNFSFMLDTPRTNSLYNLSRMFRLIERMSDHGIQTIPHINASTEADWSRWGRVLRDLSDVRMVAMEFQTGLSTVGISILVLVYGLIESSRRYALRAYRYHECALKIGRIYDALRQAKGVEPQEAKDRELCRLGKKYERTLELFENHDPIDYDIFQLQKPDYFKHAPAKKRSIKLRAYYHTTFRYHLIIVIPPLVVAGLFYFLR